MDKIGDPSNRRGNHILFIQSGSPFYLSLFSGPCPPSLSLNGLAHDSPWALILTSSGELCPVLLTTMRLVYFSHTVASGSIHVVTNDSVSSFYGCLMYIICNICVEITLLYPLLHRWRPRSLCLGTNAATREDAAVSLTDWFPVLCAVADCWATSVGPPYSVLQSRC